MMQVVKHVLVKCTRFTKLYLHLQRLIFDILSHDNFVLGFVKLLKTKDKKHKARAYI